MQIGDIAAWVAVVISIFASCVSFWQASIARRQAKLTGQQATAALSQAADAQRSANATENQFELNLSTQKKQDINDRILEIEELFAYTTKISSQVSNIANIVNKSLG
ncbi:hypothetical protein [Actinopolyspora saharensis]|uniref:hypothetical protein n=1 Tax=Actinopolyspora saharensis TaxID=995062 RepID=UPI001113B87A|nr:hypothetical protein [Actinopolyspora saharensis]